MIGVKDRWLCDCMQYSMVSYLDTGLAGHADGFCYLGCCLYLDVVAKIDLDRMCRVEIILHM
ncbi:hypothetical protein [Sporomusa sp. KB1]|uniref:hypothetical protein n=1 Tax=Sporomusa sp. KB1 TaxID=943346 RepID=UPI001C978B0E|nr:hypothetical protein [Sporomusa sp. KB1]